MKFKMVPLFTKNLCKRFAAGVHSFVHPNEHHELKRQECFLAFSLADARQNEAKARHSANESKDNAHRWQKQVHLYQEIVCLEQRLRAEEVRICEHRGFKKGYEQGHVDSAHDRDQPIYDKGHADGYAARVHDQQRLVAHERGHGGHGGHDGQLGEHSHSEIKHCNNPHSDNLDNDNSDSDNLDNDNSDNDNLDNDNSDSDNLDNDNSDSDNLDNDNSDSDNANIEDLNDYQLHDPKEIHSPSCQLSTLNHGRMIERRTESHSSRKPFFPWRGD